MLLFILIFTRCTTKINDLQSQTAEDIFNSIAFTDIVTSSDIFSSGKINSTHGPDNKIPAGTIVFFKTAEGNYGKMLIINNTFRDIFLEFSFLLYNGTGDTIACSKFTRVADTFSYDFEANEVDGKKDDFWWEWTEFHGGGKSGDPIYLTPQVGSEFLVYRY
jgi:hypothetical protein